MENTKCVHQNIASMTGLTFNNKITHAAKQRTSHSCHH